MHDARIFKRSLLSSELKNKLMANEHLVGDSAYPISTIMMVPYKDNGLLNAKQKNHNLKLSKCRGKIENTWAQLKGKWRRLKYRDMDRMDYIVEHITASCILHNIALNDDSDEE